MKRALLFCSGLLLGLVAETILWKAPDLYTFEDGWSKELTWLAGLGVIVQGAVAAAGAALCFARAFVPVAPVPAATGLWRRPLLPLCAILFLLGAIGPFSKASSDFDTLQVMETVPGGVGADILRYFRFHGQVALAFGIGYTIVGGALLVPPLFLTPGDSQVGQRINAVGCSIALIGLLLSGMGGVVWYANGLAGEGRSEEISRVACFVILAGTVLAVAGSIVALKIDKIPDRV